MRVIKNSGKTMTSLFKNISWTNTLLFLSEMLFLNALFGMKEFFTHLIETNLPGRPLPALTQIFFNSGAVPYWIIAFLLFVAFVLSALRKSKDASYSFSAISIIMLLIFISCYIWGISELLNYRGPFAK